MRSYPLSGYRVTDYGTAVAGPVVGQILADMGAEVIKVETRTHLDGIRLGRPIVGDDIAGGDEGKWPELQPMFHCINRSKLGITVDFAHPKGVALIKQLVQLSDVITENFSPRVLKEHGLDYESMKEVKPDIVMLSMSGGGQYGPLRDIVTYAPAVTALAGLSSMMGYYGERVLGVGLPSFADLNASLHGAFAILAALRYRNRTGEGLHIDLSQSEAATCLVGEAIMEYTMNHRVLGTSGNRNPTMAPHNNYHCKGEDKWVSIAVKTEEDWRSFCTAIGNPSWTTDARFSDRYSRLANQVEMDEFICQWTVNHTPHEVTVILQKAGVAAAPVMNVEDHFVDPHFAERQIYAEIDQPMVGAETIPSLPWKLSETPGGIRRGAPMLGEHNSYIFGELLGLSQDEINQLTEEKVLY